MHKELRSYDRINFDTNDISFDYHVKSMYDKVLSGERNRFPHLFFEGELGKEFSTILIKYLIEDILKWNNSDIKKYLNYEVFARYKLAIMLALLYDYDPIKAISETYPERNYRRQDFRYRNVLHWEDRFPRKSYFDWDKYLEGWVYPQRKDSMTFSEACEIFKEFIDSTLKGKVKSLNKKLKSAIQEEHNISVILSKYDICSILERLYPGQFTDSELDKIYEIAMSLRQK